MDLLELIITIIELVTIILSVAIAGIAFAVPFVWGVTSYKKQMDIQLFLEFTKRFDEIMQSFPENAWAARFNLDYELPPVSKELTRSALRYLNLCSEEYYLYYQKHWLNKEIWEIWKDELVRTLCSPLFLREWKELSREFGTYHVFKNYVDEIQKVPRQHTESE